MLRYIVGLFFACAVVNSQQPTRFRVLYEWNYINFTWPSEEILRSAIATSRYIPENNHISGVKYFDDYLYLTVPRMKDGVPATLTRIPYNAQDSNTSPLLEPYPSWEMNTEEDCNALQNVQNLEIDTNGLLWILDGGRTKTITKQPNNKCQPRLLIFDTKTNTTVTTYTFPQEFTNNGSFLYDLVLDNTDGGYAYITDNSGVDPGIIVYSMKQSRAWIVRDDTMKAVEQAVDFVVNGTAVSARINIAGIAIGPRISSMHGDHEIVSQDRMVYYCPLSSYRLYSVNSAVLKDEKSTINGIASHVTDLGRKASQTDGMIMDENGILYFGLLADNSIAKWDSKTLFTSGQKVIARDRIFIQWPDSLSFDLSGNLLAVTNRLQKFIYGKLNLNEANFRILQGHVGAKSYLYTDQNNDDITSTSTENMPMTSTESSTTIKYDSSSSMESKNRTYYDVHTTQSTEVVSEAHAHVDQTMISLGNSHHKSTIFSFVAMVLFMIVVT